MLQDAAILVFSFLNETKYLPLSETGLPRPPELHLADSLSLRSHLNNLLLKAVSSDHLY